MHSPEVKIHTTPDILKQKITKIKHFKKEISEAERLEMVKFEIYNFYSKQHIRRDISFDQQDREQKMDKGELTGFCRDFMMLPPKSKIHEVFRHVSPL